VLGPVHTCFDVAILLARDREGCSAVKEMRDGKATVTVAAAAAPEVVHCARSIRLGNVREEPRFCTAHLSSVQKKIPTIMNCHERSAVRHFATWFPGHRGHLN
jgi:hypothetical protein